MSKEVGNPDLFSSSDQPFPKLLFKHLRHPNEPLKTAVAQHELALRNVILTVPHKPRRHVATPIVPARVVNFIPLGVIPVKSRLTVMMPLHMGKMAAMHSQQPQVVMGSYTML